ncbi:outer membrane beta-barrel protein [Vibrio sp. FNV 38]|nr:outer membrane beta-barrel protein [Vibrio sp. FNV 38]
MSRYSPLHGWFVISLLTLLSTSFVWARPFNYEFSEQRSQGFTPFINAELGHNSNVTHSSDHEISSGFATLTPGGEYTFRKGESRFSGLYIADAGYYFDSSDDSYFDQYVELNASMLFGIRHRLELIYGFHDTHEERGQGVTEGISQQVNDLIEYQQQQFLSTYTFGAHQAKGQIRVHAGLESRQYQNYRMISQTDGTKYSDYDSLNYGGRFLYRIRGESQAFIGIDRQDRQYDYTQVGLASRDSVSDYYAIGALWQISGKTRGEASIGYQSKDFDSNSFQDFSGLSWRANLTWQPKNQTRFKLRTSQSAQDPDRYGGYTDETYVGLAWEQQWRDRLLSTLGASWKGSQFNDGLYEGRNDDVLSALVKLEYKYNRQLSFGGQWEYEDKTSNNNNVEYTQHIFGVITQVKF